MIVDDAYWAKKQAEYDKNRAASIFYFFCKAAGFAVPATLIEYLKDAEVAFAQTR